MPPRRQHPLRLLLVATVVLGAGVARAAPADAAPASAVTMPPPPTPGRARILVLDMKPNAVEPTLAATVTSFVVAGLSEYPTLDVISGEDVKNLVQLEATRAGAGCSEEASCLSEIAGALGAQLVVFGAVGKLGEATVVSINLFDSQRAAALGRVTTQTTHQERLPARIARKLHELVAGYHADHNLVLRPAPPPEPGPDMTPWIVTGVSAAVAVGGGIGALVGVLPLLDYNAATARVQAAESRFASDPATALADGKAAQADLVAAREAFNGYGYLALDVGAAITIAALLAAGGGAAWAVGSAEPPDPDTPSTLSAPAVAGGAR